MTKLRHHCETHGPHEDILCDKCFDALLAEGRKDRKAVSKRLKQMRPTAKSMRTKLR